jgi:hypothetical protein
VRLEGLGKLKKKKSTSWGLEPKTFPACNIVPQPTTLLRVPSFREVFSIIFLKVNENRRNRFRENRNFDSCSQFKGQLSVILGPECPIPRSSNS